MNDWLIYLSLILFVIGFYSLIHLLLRKTKGVKE